MTDGDIFETEQGKLPLYTYFMIPVAGRNSMMGTLQRASEWEGQTTARTSKEQEVSGVTSADTPSAKERH
jgi:hypothetical protein